MRVYIYQQSKTHLPERKQEEPEGESTEDDFSSTSIDDIKDEEEII